MNPASGDLDLEVDERARRLNASGVPTALPHDGRRTPREPVFDAEPGGALRTRESLTKAALGVADALAAVLAVGTVLAYATGHQDRPQLLLLVPLILGIHKIAGLYDRDELVLRRSTLDELPVLVQLSSVFALCVAAGGEVLFQTRLGPQQLAGLWLLTAGLVAVLRMVARSIVVRFAPPERCLLLGDADHVRHLRDKLNGSHQSVHVVAAINLDRQEGERVEIADLRHVIDAHQVHRVVLAPTSRDSAETVDLVRMAKAAGVRVSILPRVLEAVGSAVELLELDGVTMLGVRRLGLSASSLAIKRAFDLVVGSVIFVATLPLFLTLALAVKLDSRGPVFFRQVRIGRDGRPFRIRKFRSMVTDAEAMKRELEALNEAGPGMFKVADDPRVTRVGRFLRRTSLDELPQVLNVLSGEMSLVGPRPLIVDEDALVQGLYRARLHLTPGMTGPWQILGATRVPMDEMVGIDYLYVANWSLWEDVKLLLRTVPHVLARRGL